jgi:Bacterial SH3 domain
MRRLSVGDLPPVRNAAGAHRRIGHRLSGPPAALLIAFLLASCAPKAAAPQEAVGLAYVGPATLNLRDELTSRSKTAATVKQGERLEILETRRKFVKVRTAQGVEGWTDSNNLLSQREIDELDRFGKSVAHLPAQGLATVYDKLNVHTAPNRQSGVVTQIPEGGRFEVIGHRVTPRVVESRAPVKVAAVKAAAPKPAKKEDPNRPPMPDPPPLPSNWLDLSHPRADELPASPEASDPAAKPDADDWYLVRTPSGRAGWVLAHQVYMLIPDEVAQYAERQMITSYTALGQVVDKDDNMPHNNWLWTTSAERVEPQDFDSFRVFVWSTRHHRYETAYIERNVKGYYPVETQDAPGQQEKAFSVILEDKTGQLFKRTYAFSGFRVRMVSKVPYERPAPLPEMIAARSAEPPPPAKTSSWRDKLRGLRKRWFGR